MGKVCFPLETNQIAVMELVTRKVYKMVSEPENANTSANFSGPDEYGAPLEKA